MLLEKQYENTFLSSFQKTSLPIILLFYIYLLILFAAAVVLNFFVLIAQAITEVHYVYFFDALLYHNHFNFEQICYSIFVVLYDSTYYLQCYEC